MESWRNVERESKRARQRLINEGEREAAILRYNEGENDGGVGRIFFLR